MTYIIERRPIRYNWRGAWNDPPVNRTPWETYRRYKNRYERNRRLRELQRRLDGYEYREGA